MKKVIVFAAFAWSAFTFAADQSVWTCNIIGTTASGESFKMNGPTRSGRSEAQAAGVAVCKANGFVDCQVNFCKQTKR